MGKTISNILMIFCILFFATCIGRKGAIQEGWPTCPSPPPLYCYDSLKTITYNQNIFPEYDSIFARCVLWFWINGLTENQYDSIWLKPWYDFYDTDSNNWDCIYLEGSCFGDSNRNLLCAMNPLFDTNDLLVVSDEIYRELLKSIEVILVKELEKRIFYFRDKSINDWIGLYTRVPESFFIEVLIEREK